MTLAGRDGTSVGLSGVPRCFFLIAIAISRTCEVFSFCFLPVNVIWLHVCYFLTFFSGEFPALKNQAQQAKKNSDKSSKAKVSGAKQKKEEVVLSTAFACLSVTVII